MKALLILFAASALAFGYIRLGAPGPYEYRPDNTNVQFLLNANAVGGMKNAAGQTWITSESNVPAAIANAVAAWNNVTTANIHFAPVTTTNSEDGAPGLNVIAFDDTPENQEALGGALAVTIRYLATNGTGAILKSDIIFNPNDVFSTTLASGTYDIQAVVTHELGHSLGADHSGVLSASMFQAIGPQTNSWATLSPDDIAFATAAYPVANPYGAVTGMLRDTNGNPLRGALVSLQNPTTGAMIGGLSSLTDGSFSIAAPAGTYHAWAEPLSGLVQSGNLYLASTAAVDTDFQPTAASAPLKLSAGGSTAVALSANNGISPIQVQFAAALPATNLYAGPSVITSGQTVAFQFEATGLGTGLADADVQFIGPVTLVPGSIQALQGLQYRMNLNVPPVSSPTSASMLVNYDGNTAVYSGGLILLPPIPVFIPAGVANVFSYSAGPVAPGEIVALFGSNLGPTAGATGSINSSGKLSTQAGQVQVTFDGEAAPIFYAGSGQINVEVPFSVAGKSSMQVIVTNGSSASAAVTLPVQAAQPGLFSHAVNPDGTLNSATNPAGSYAILYVTGLGAIPGVSTGQVVTGAASAPNVQVSVDGGPMTTPSYAGAAPGFTGLDQINLVGLPSGAHSVQVSASGQLSQTVQLWMQ